jgi:predicted nuclease of restriction endonuclease-like RecB superfamily
VWLEPRVVAWLRVALEAFDACEGLTAAQVASRGRALSVDARRSGISDIAVRGVWHVLRRWARTLVDAPVAPRRLREEMFTMAATAPVDDVLQLFCRRFEIGADRLRSWLYADLPEARVLRTAELPTPERLRDAYNMSLAQGVVGRCTRVTVRIDENVRAVVRAAKLRGLLVSVDAEGPLIHASGPLVLFRQTVKYARALATFIPSLVSMPGWVLEGDLYLGSTRDCLRIDGAAPLPRETKLPKRTDSGLETSLMRALRRSNSEWSILREPIVLRAGQELFFPDFVLGRGVDRVVVEVVGFWTPEYLARKVSHLATVTDLPLVVCVDEGLACDPSRLPGADVVRFRRRLDAAVLLAAAERAASSWRARQQEAGTSSHEESKTRASGSIS